MKAIVLSIFVFFSIQKVSFSIQDPSEDIRLSLFAQWEDETLPDTVRLKALNNIFWKIYFFTDPDSAIHFAEIQYDFATERSNQLWQGRALNNIGTGWYFKGDIPLALDYHERSLEILTKTGDKRQIAHALNNMGLDYSLMADLTKAIQCLFASMRLREEVGDKKGVADSQNNIGVQYNDFGEYDLAIEYYEKALSAYEELGDQQSIASIRNNIGTVYADLDEYDKSFTYLFQALRIYEQINSPYGVTNANVNIGQNHLDLKNYDSAFYYFDRCISLSAEIDDIWRIAEAQTLIGRAYMEQGDYRTALSYCERAIPVLQEVSDIGRVRDAYEYAYECSKALGKSDQALEMHEQFVIFRDSLLNEEDLRVSIGEQYRYEYDKQASIDSLRTIEAQKTADAKVLAQKAELANSDTQQYALYGGIAFLLLIVGLVLNSRRILREQKLAVEENESLLEKQKEGLKGELKEKNKELTTFALNLAQRNEFLQEVRTELSKASKRVDNPRALAQLKELGIKIHQYGSNNAEDEEFRRKLEEHNSNFYSDLKKRLPRLSRKEKRLCALLRLGLSSKEIASIANISPKSVDISRYRLRQKLGIKKGEDLHQYMLNI